MLFFFLSFFLAQIENSIARNGSKIQPPQENHHSPMLHDNASIDLNPQRFGKTVSIFTYTLQFEHARGSTNDTSMRPPCINSHALILGRGCGCLRFLIYHAPKCTVAEQCVIQHELNGVACRSWHAIETCKGWILNYVRTWLRITIANLH